MVILDVLDKILRMLPVVLIGVEAVSYPHLDVYKRQFWYSDIYQRIGNI